MTVFHGLDEAQACSPPFLAIGNFDGVHRGHQTMIRLLRKRATAAGCPAVVMTFDPSPVEVLKPHLAPPRLMTREQKAARLMEVGADHVIVVHATPDLLALSPEEFFHDVLIGRLQVRGMVEGANFHFGRDRAGDVTLLAELCRDADVSLEIAPSLEVDGEMVSSSRIRKLVHAGEVARAAELLGHPYELSGIVESGAKRGKQLGFPTANLGQIATLLPLDGVYAGRVVHNGQTFTAAVHLGPNSTFDQTHRTLEAHLLDFSGDLYGERLTVSLIERLRGTMRFPDPLALQEALQSDIARVRELAGRQSVR